MNQHITQNGITLYYKLDYDLGGYSHATNRVHPRGYYLSVRRQPNRFLAHQGLENDAGAVRIFLHEVTRKSKKQEQIAKDMVHDKLLEVEKRYNL